MSLQMSVCIQKADQQYLNTMLTYGHLVNPFRSVTNLDTATPISRGMMNSFANKSEKKKEKYEASICRQLEDEPSF